MTLPRKVYCTGFMTDGMRVALIEKNRPPWMSGKLNGIGGKLESFETPELAMVREFGEETGLLHKDWRHFCTLRTKNKDEESVIYFYSAFVPTHVLSMLETRTDEPVRIVSIREPAYELHQRSLPNVPWLFAMALSMERGETARAFDVTELYY